MQIGFHLIQAVDSIGGVRPPVSIAILVALNLFFTWALEYQMWPVFQDFDQDTVALFVANFLAYQVIELGNHTPC